LNWQGRKVLVTGAGGFIGSHLVEALVQAGAAVSAFVRYTSRGDFGLLRLLPADVHDAIEVVAGDLRDPEAVREAVRGNDVVFHLAALIAIPYSYVHPTEVSDVNVQGTINVLNAARDMDVSRIVHTSTSEVYGTARTAPIREDHPLQPQSPYSATKIGADAIARSYHLAFGLPVTTLRPFNTYGPRQSGRAVIPTIIGQALRSDEVRLGSLTPTRDFNFATDTAAAFMAIAQCDEALGEALNAGTGKEISIGELAERIVSRVGRDVRIASTDERVRPEKSEVHRLICDSTRLHDLTGWSPGVSLDEGLDRVIEFIREHPDWTNINRYEV
jgi:NAD dependent epimerase/dehydratase